MSNTSEIPAELASPLAPSLVGITLGGARERGVSAMKGFRLGVFTAILAAMGGAEAVRGTESTQPVDGLPPALATFDRELRDALSRQDTQMLSLLVQFPLQLNHGDGGVTSLVNARALQTRFKEAFPDAVRAVVLSTRPEDLFQWGSTVGYSDGIVWLAQLGEGESARYRVISVNLPRSPGDCTSACPQSVEFVCDAAKHRVIVDRVGDGKPRYRAWNKPRSPAQPPDLELTQGEVTSEGTTPCTSSTWTFRNGSTLYTVSERGCWGSPEGEDLVGWLQVSGPGETEVEWQCF